MSTQSDEEYSEYKVCSVAELEDGGKNENMKLVQLGEEGKCLLVRHNDGEITALSHKCTHYGAPLIKGVLSNGRVRCPWHGACFNTKTGDIEDFPGLDSLQRFKVTLKNGDVIVGARKRQIVNSKRNPLAEMTNDLAKINVAENDSAPDDSRVVIIGGGPSSLTCCETLRKEGFEGQIVILSKEVHPTYDRPKLSKALDVEPQNVYLRPPEYYKEIKVEFYHNAEVVSVDVVTKSVNLAHPLSLDNGETVKSVTYDNLVLATGGQPRTLAPLPGWNLQNVFVLRTVSDSNAIADASKEKHVVVVGASFIGMEVASYLASKSNALSLSVVCGKRSSVPFQNSFGKDVGAVVMKMHKEKGVQFYPSVGVASLSSANGKNAVSHVTLTDGRKIEADVVVVGTGVTPATSFLTESQIAIAKNGFIAVDGRMQTKVPHVYAIGDIAVFPLQIRDGSLTNIQHWQMAHTHGVIAARDIAKSSHRANQGHYTNVNGSSSITPVKSVPFFWTVQFGVSIRYAGYGAGYDNVEIKGSLEEQKFVAYYMKDDVVVAVATMKMDPVAAQFAEDLFNGKVLTRKDIP